MRTLVVFTVGLLAILNGCQGDSPECDKPGPHNFFWGQKSYYDTIVYNVNTKLDSKWLRKQSVDVVYPPKGVVPDGRTITYINVTDNKHDGSGGCAYLANGGVGQKTVTIHLKTQRSKGLDFNVVIYAA